MKKILFAASEAVPFVKTGGLADVVGSLPKYFDAKKFDVRVILPNYACIDKKIRKHKKPLVECFVDLGWRRQYAGVYETKADGITYYLIDNEFYFAGPHPYGEIYQDVEKFAFFSKSVLTVLDKIGFWPDVIHCNDWQTGLIPVFLKRIFCTKEKYRKIRTVFSIHNIRFQGRWKLAEVQDATGLPQDVFTPEGIESYGESNYLKGGIVYADAVTTVSRSYAMEIMTPEGGEGLDGVLRRYSYKLFGILNGLDYDVFNPKTDAFLPARFDMKNVMRNKPKNKAALQAAHHLKHDPDAFLIGMVSRMSDQKGFELVASVLEELLAQGGIQIAVLGTGEERYEAMFCGFAKRYPDRISANIGYSEREAHLIYAGADAFLMPSLFEPCGLCQLIAMRYGTVPIVRETGGLRDTVEPYNKFTQEGTGFSFANYDAGELAAMVHMAKEVYETEKENWQGLMLRGMKRNFSWKSSVEEYGRLYESIC